MWFVFVPTSLSKVELSSIAVELGIVQLCLKISKREIVVERQLGIFLKATAGAGRRQRIGTSICPL